MTLKGWSSVLVITLNILSRMEEVRLVSAGRVKTFLDGESEVALRISKGRRNHFIERVSRLFGYPLHDKVDKSTKLR